MQVDGARSTPTAQLNQGYRVFVRFPANIERPPAVPGEAAGSRTHITTGRRRLAAGQWSSEGSRCCQCRSDQTRPTEERTQLCAKGLALPLLCCVVEFPPKNLLAGFAFGHRLTTMLGAAGKGLLRACPGARRAGMLPAAASIASAAARRCQPSALSWYSGAVLRPTAVATQLRSSGLLFSSMTASRTGTITYPKTKRRSPVLLRCE